MTTHTPNRPPTGGRPRVVVDRVITQNVWAHAPVDLARAVLRSLLDYDPDVVGLQEWPNGRNQVLKEVGAFRRWPTPHREVQALVRRLTRAPWQPGTGYVSVRPILGPTGPMIFRADRYEITRVYAHTLTGRYRVKPTKRHPKPWKPPNRVTVVETIDHATGRPTAFIDYHLNAGVQTGNGKYRKGKADRARVRGHQAQVAALDKLTLDYKGRGFDVYDLGDSNFDGLRIAGVTSAWAGRPHDRRGTHGKGHRKIDDVHGPGPAVNVDVVRYPNPKIDHAAVVADRHREIA